MSLTMRGLVQLLRGSTPAIKTNTTILTAARHRRFSAGIGSKQGSGDVVNSGPKPLVVTETKPADGKGKDDTVKLEICGDVEDEEEIEEMLQDGPAGKEWGGPTRGGVLSEPTRFGDWERKGRCSDF